MQIDTGRQKNNPNTVSYVKLVKKGGVNKTFLKNWIYLGRIYEKRDIGYGDVYGTIRRMSKG